jgi:lsr operon transcriptional repressor
MGGLTRGSDLNSFEITTRLADLMGAQHSYFTAPLYAGSRESRDTIMQLDVFREVLEKLRGVDALAMAAGDLSRRSLLMRDGLPSDVTMEELRAMGAVGDVLGVVIDAEGQPIPHPINERVIGIGLPDLARIPNVILAAGGPHKVPVVRAVLGAAWSTPS